MKRTKADKYDKRGPFNCFIFLVSLFTTVLALYAAIIGSSAFLLLVSAFCANVARCLWTQRNDSIVVSDAGIEYDIHKGFFSIEHLKGEFKWSDGNFCIRFKELILTYSNSDKAEIKIQINLFSSEMLISLYSHDRNR